MPRSTPKSFLRKITQIESIVRLIKDDFLRDHLIPEMNTLNLVISELETLRDFSCNHSTDYASKIRNVN